MPHLLPLVGLAVLLGTPPSSRPAPNVVRAPETTGPVFNGRAGATTVTTPRIDRGTVVDGVLDEPEWSNAALLTGFSQFFPTDGVAAQDSTETLVWYSATELHIGIRAFAPAGTVRATLSDRDRIAQDDNVQFFLGTYGDSRQALVFGVNPFGIQSDGVLTETGAQTGGGFTSSTARSRESADLAPDYVWKSKGRITATGYEVEIAIPFKSLRYRAGAEQQWQLHVIRTVQATGHEQSWAPAVRASASFLAQSGRLVGLRDLSRGLTLDIIPTVTSSATGGRDAATTRWAYTRQNPEVGGSVRWGITSNLTLAATANPDFSQVEADATQFSLDPRAAVFYAERRPFFLESQEQFSTPNRLIYTRRIVQPVAATKLTGKYEGFDIGFLSAVDSKDASLDGKRSPFYNVLRLQRDIGKQSRLGLAYTDRVEGDAWNRVLGVDGRYVRGILSVQGQVARSFTGEADTTRQAPLWDVSSTLNGKHFYARYNLNGISANFDAGSGFISRPGIANLQATHRYNYFGKPGALIEAFSPEVYLFGRYQYDDFVNGRAPQDRQFHIRTNTRLRGGWQLGAQVLIERFGYDERLFANYATFQPRTGGGVDTVPYVGTAILPNLDYVMSIATPEFKRFSFNTFLILGQDENFPEWSSAVINVWQGGLNVRPTEQLRLAATWNREQYLRKTDRSLVQFRNVRRLRTEYQLSRQIFIRVIGELTDNQQDALRDDSRTGAPVFLRNANGTYRPATAFDQRRARLDYLFSYLPNPGTVFYFGYGDSRRADEPIGSRTLERVRDVFFLKLSYLLRVQ